MLFGVDMDNFTLNTVKPASRWEVLKAKLLGTKRVVRDYEENIETTIYSYKGIQYITKMREINE